MKDSVLPSRAHSLGESIHGFMVEAVDDLEDVRSVAYLLNHEKSGARLLHLHSNDEENLFAIALRTPPPDHSGLIFPDPRFWSWGGSRSDLGISARREAGIGPGGWNNCKFNDTTNQSGALQRHRSVYKIQRTSGSHCRADITILLPEVPSTGTPAGRRSAAGATT